MRSKPESRKRRCPPRFRPPRRGLGIREWQDTLHSFVPGPIGEQPALTVDGINRLLAEAAEEDRMALIGVADKFEVQASRQ